MTLRRVAIPSPNWSGRGGAAVRLIVLHTAEGARTYQDLGRFFQNPAAGVSSHTGIDDTPGTIGEYVPRSGKAWTAGNANPVAVQVELCAFASWTPATWAQHPTMLANCAAWIAEEAAAFGIPIVKLTAAQAQGSGRGICQHNDLGAWGGGHWDCGPGFPIDQVIAMAAGAPAPQPPAPEEEEANMTLQDPVTNGIWVVKPDGAVLAYDGARFLGGSNGARFGTAGKPCVGIALRDGPGGTGYVTTHRWGNDDYRRYFFPADGTGK